MPQGEERSWIDTDVLVPLGLDDYVVDSDDHYSRIVLMSGPGRANVST